VLGSGRKVVKGMGSNFVQGDYFVLGKPGKPRRLPAVILTAALLAGLVFIPSVARAGKGGNGKGNGVTAGTATSSIALNESSYVGLGGTVTFSASAAGLAGWEYPMVAVWCYQNDALVYMELATPDTAFVLGGSGSEWRTSGGPADCSAVLYAYGWKGGQESIRELASTPFHAEG
jgi:hypothetical protein